MLVFLLGHITATHPILRKDDAMKTILISLAAIVGMFLFQADVSFEWYQQGTRGLNCYLSVVNLLTNK